MEEINTQRIDSQNNADPLLDQFDAHHSISIPNLPLNLTPETIPNTEDIISRIKETARYRNNIRRVEKYNAHRQTRSAKSRMRLTSEVELNIPETGPGLELVRVDEPNTQPVRKNISDFQPVDVNKIMRNRLKHTVPNAGQIALHRASRPSSPKSTPQAVPKTNVKSLGAELKRKLEDKS